MFARQRRDGWEMPGSGNISGIAAARKRKPLSWREGGRSLLLLVLLFERFVIAMRARAALGILIGWARLVIADAAALDALHQLLQIIVDSVVVEGFTLAQQMPQHHDLRHRGLALALGLRTAQELLHQLDAVFTRAVQLELIANCRQLFVCVHPWLPSGRAARTAHAATRSRAARSSTHLPPPI